MDRDGPEAGKARLQRMLIVSLLLALTLLVRLHAIDQPIVENYVGRQIPTAMVARNLERGSGFTRPSLDTAPFPNFFLVEPRVYQSAVCGLRRLTGWRLEACGRLISALATTLAVIGLSGLVSRREGTGVAFPAVIAFGLLPVTVRYGRVFQPDALALGMTLIGVDFWDRVEHGSSPLWRIPGWIFLAVGLAAKASYAFVLVPLWLVVLGGRSNFLRCLAAATIVPALAWYAWANHLVDSGVGSAASAENRSIWLKLLGFSALGSVETLGHVGRFFLIRAFTPIGLALACWGVLCRPRAGESATTAGPPDGGWDLWKVWAGAGLFAMAMLASKLHHEYYWLALAPVVAAGLGRAWPRLTNFHPLLAWTGLAGFLTMSLGLSASTFRTPAEWRPLASAAESVRREVPAGALLVAPEPLLYQADFRGCRLEYTADAARRAADEWRDPGSARVGGPLELIEFYRTMGARYLADVGAGPSDARRTELHRAVRERYQVLADRESVFIVELRP